MSNYITKADVIAVAAGLSTLSDAVWVIVLNFINDFEGLDCDPSLRKLALCLLSAHIGSVTGSVGASGATTAVTSESAGGLKRTYAQPTSSSSMSALERTTYGQQFLAILRMSISTGGPFLV